MLRTTRHYDVVVIGGGAAGLAAALGALRAGADTLLIERYGFLGGAATNANVLSYCGFYAQGDEPRPMVAGVGRDVLRELTNVGFDTTPRRAPSGNWIILLDPESVKYAFDRVSSPVACRLHCSLVSARRRDRRIEAITLHDHAGLFEITGAAFVDASGESDLGFVAGAMTVADRDPQRAHQPATFPVRLGGVAANLDIDRAALAAVHAAFANDHPLGVIRKNGGHMMRLPQSNDLWWMGIDLVTDGLDSADLAGAERLGRDLAWKFVERMRVAIPGFEKVFIAATGPQLGVRDTRQVVPRHMLTDDDVLQGRVRADSIARGCWPAEVHVGLEGARFAPIAGDGYYSIPLDAVRANDIDNLWLGGRVIGCSPAAYGSIRVMGTAFATGQAAGVAAALFASDVKLVGDSTPVQAELQRQGAII